MLSEISGSTMAHWEAYLGIYVPALRGSKHDSTDTETIDGPRSLADKDREHLEKQREARG